MWIESNDYIFGDFRKHIKVLMVSRIQILASVNGNNWSFWVFFNFIFVFYNLFLVCFWKLCIHLVILLIIYLKIKFKKLISRNTLFSVYLTNWCQKGEEWSKSQSFEPLCFLLKLGGLKPLTLPATVAIHGYLMICASYIVFLLLLFFLLIFVGSGSL